MMAAVIHEIELVVKGVFFQADEGEAARNEKVAQIKAAVASVPALENVEISSVKVKEVK